MTEQETVVLMGRVRERAHPDLFNEAAWRVALLPLDAGRAGTAVIRHLAGLRPSDEPSIDEFLALYGPLPVDHPASSRRRRRRHLDDEPTPVPPAACRPDPCDVCDSTGWTDTDQADPSQGVRPCSCEWGARVRPTLDRLRPIDRARPEVPVGPPWLRTGGSLTDPDRWLPGRAS